MQQFLPFLRLDGYYILSDLTGVPDMFQRLRPTLRSLLPWRKNEREVEALKPWVRWAITGWVIALIPVMLGTFGLLLFNLPRMAATAWDSFWIQTDRIVGRLGGGRASHRRRRLDAGALPRPAGRRHHRDVQPGRGAASSAAAGPGRRGHSAAAPGSCVSVGALAGLAAYVLLPNGEYRPIQPGERGTILGGLSQFDDVGTGRPGLTDEREQDLGGAPTERESPQDELPPEETPVGQTPPSETSTGETSTTEEPETTTDPLTETTDTTETATTDTTATETTQTTTTTETTTTETTTTTPTTTTEDPEVQP